MNSIEDNNDYSTKFYDKNSIPDMSTIQGPGSIPLYLRATIDPGAHLSLDARVNSLAAHTLVDSGATGIFMHLQFAAQCRAGLREKLVPREVRVIDGRVINSGLITHEAVVEFVIDDHREWLVVDITNTGRYLCILGTPWLIRHDPTIRWSQRRVFFDSSYCKGHCLEHRPSLQSVAVGLGTGGIIPISKDN